MGEICASGVMAQGAIIDKKFYWNLDANVGPGCPNKTEDVQLVQLGYFCMSNNPKVSVPPEERAAYAAVTPGAPYTAAPDDPLTIAIKLHQKRRGTIPDGRVSSIKNSTGFYDGTSEWMIMALDNNIADALGEAWPHLNKHPRCPGPLRDTAIQTLTVFRKG